MVEGIRFQDYPPLRTRRKVTTQIESKENVMKNLSRATVLALVLILVGGMAACSSTQSGGVNSNVSHMTPTQREVVKLLDEAKTGLDHLVGERVYTSRSQRVAEMSGQVAGPKHFETRYSFPGTTFGPRMIRFKSEALGLVASGLSHSDLRALIADVEPVIPDSWAGEPLHRMGSLVSIQWKECEGYRGRFVTVAEKGWTLGPEEGRNVGPDIIIGVYPDSC